MKSLLNALMIAKEMMTAAWIKITLFVMQCNINQEIISLRHLNQLEKKSEKLNKSKKIRTLQKIGKIVFLHTSVAISP